MSYGRKAFTIIELLAVIAIIVILAGILFPVFASARDRARATTCLSNLKQLGIASQMYIQAYDGLYMPHDYRTGEFWFGKVEGQQVQIEESLLYPFLKNGHIQRCPNFSGVFKFGGATAGYGYNYGYLTENWTAPGIAEGKLKRPADVVVFGDSASYEYWVDPPRVAESFGLFPPSSTIQFNSPSSQFRHSGRTNLVFADGHAASALPGLKSVDPALKAAELHHLGKVDAEYFSGE